MQNDNKHRSTRRQLLVDKRRHWNKYGTEISTVTELRRFTDTEYKDNVGGTASWKAYLGSSKQC